MSSVSILWLSVQVAVFSLVGAAVFVLLRRRGPSAAIACAATVLLLTLPFLALALSPWPRWELPAKSNESTAAVVAERVAEPAINDPPDLTAIAAPVDFVEEPPQEPALAQWWHNAVDWFQTAQQPAETAVEVQPATWRSWLPWIVAAGVAFGFVRLTVGIWAVRSYRRCSTVVEDAGLSELVNQITEQLRAAGPTAAQCTPHAPREERKQNSAPIKHHHPAEFRHHAERDEYTKLEIRETSRLRSAATIGWRRPVLLLPADWRTWTETERRVVIAHELAHIARRDYLLVLVARFVTAIHFYQPLVLWLARQLRVQQELAADAQAAAITGSRQTYLTTLAQMALRADDQPIPWAARAFLPGTGLLVKRVTWLKRNKTQEDRTMNRRSRWILAVTMAVIALFVAGIRGPGDSVSTPAFAATQSDENSPIGKEPSLEKSNDLLPQAPNQSDESKADRAEPMPLTTQSPIRNLDYLPGDSKVAAAISPASLLKFPSTAKLIPLLDVVDLLKPLAIKAADLEDMVLVKTTDIQDKTWDRAIFLARKPGAWSAFRDSLQGHTRISLEQKAANDKKYYLITEQSGVRLLDDLPRCFFQPDDRTLVMATEEEVTKLLTAEGNIAGVRQATLMDHPIAIRFDPEWLRKRTGLERQPEGIATPTAALLPLLEMTDAITFGASVKTAHDPADDEAIIEIVLHCKQPGDTKRVAKTLEAALILAHNLVTLEKGDGRTAKHDLSRRDQIAFLAELYPLLGQALDNAEIRSQDRWAIAKTEFPLLSLAKLAAVVPAVEISRDAGRRTQSMNNMKQIMLGFNNHEDKLKRLPANIRDKHGKPLLSWRVALLPEFGGIGSESWILYREFHLDEPWDSEHNIKLLGKIPAVYRHPKDDPGSTNASYFMPSGEGTIGRNAPRTSMANLSDGTSKTIALIEAKRAIPWTKPEDIEIEFDPAKPLLKFGGFFDGLFNAGFTDGHVITISDAADPAILRKFFTIAGGEPVSEDQLVPPKPANGGKAPVHSGNQPAASGDTNDNAAAARQKENIINLRKIGVALHNYAAAYRHFPPPVIVGADGRTKYSWRVAILPFIEGHAMTVEYRFDEPWDSKHNQKVMAEIPDALCSPFDAPDSTNTSYFMVSGKGMFGDNDEGRVAEEGRVVREITDGMANTIMVVEAKRSVPWTKPEDIEVDPDKPLPKFGGFLPNGLFSASFSSGHVRTIPGSVDADALRALFTIAGGEAVDMDAVLNPQRAGVNSQTPPAMKPDPAVRLNPARRVRIEFRLGEAQPGEGLAEIELPGQPKVYVHDKAELTSEDIAAVTMIVDTNTNAPGLNILFTPDGAKKMEQLTEANLRKRLVILADGKVLSAPTIRSKISSKAMVTGNFTQEEVVRIVKGFHGE